MSRRKHAMEMLLTGEMVSAEHALRIGLVNRVVPAAQERDAALAFARKIAAKSSAVVTDRQGSVLSSARIGAGRRLPTTADVMVENMIFKDAEEGIGAFIDKRPPVWDDR